MNEPSSSPTPERVVNALRELEMPLVEIQRKTPTFTPLYQQITSVLVGIEVADEALGPALFDVINDAIDICDRHGDIRQKLDDAGVLGKLKNARIELATVHNLSPNFDDHGRDILLRKYTREAVPTIADSLVLLQQYAATLQAGNPVKGNIEGLLSVAANAQASAPGACSYIVNEVTDTLRKCRAQIEAQQPHAVAVIEKITNMDVLIQGEIAEANAISHARESYSDTLSDAIHTTRKQPPPSSPSMGNL